MWLMGAIAAIGPVARTQDDSHEGSCIREDIGGNCSCERQTPRHESVRGDDELCIEVVASGLPLNHRAVDITMLRDGIVHERLGRQGSEIHGAARRKFHVRTSKICFLHARCCSCPRLEERGPGAAMSTSSPSSHSGKNRAHLRQLPQTNPSFDSFEKRVSLWQVRTSHQAVLVTPSFHTGCLSCCFSLAAFLEFLLQTTA